MDAKIKTHLSEYKIFISEMYNYKNNRSFVVSYFQYILGEKESCLIFNLTQ